MTSGDGPAEDAAPAAVCDGGDLDCGSGLLVIIRAAMAPLAAGAVLEVRSRERRGDYAPLLPHLARMDVQQFVLEYATPRADRRNCWRSCRPTAASALAASTRAPSRPRTRRPSPRACAGSRGCWAANVCS